MKEPMNLILQLFAPERYRDWETVFFNVSVKLLYFSKYCSLHTIAPYIVVVFLVNRTQLIFM